MASMESTTGSGRFKRFRKVEGVQEVQRVQG
jgi:hypothetical protein